MALKDDANELKGLLGDINQALKEIDNESKIIGDGFSSTKDSLSSIVSIAQQLNETQKSSSNLSSDQVKNLQSQLSNNKNNLKLAQQHLAAQIEGNQKQLQRLKNLKNQEKNVEKLNQLIFEQKSAYEMADDVLKDINGDVSNIETGLKKAADAANFDEKLAKANKVLSGFKNPLDMIGGGLTSWLSPLGLINNLMSFFVDTAKETDKELGEAAKGMNMTYEEAGKARKEMMAVADASGDFLLNAQAMQKTVVGLNQALGTTVKYSDMSATLQEDVNLMSKLSTYAGLTAEETQSIQKLSMGAGKSAKENTKELMASYKIQGLNSKLVLNEKDALKAIANTSKAIQVSMGGSGKELGKALASAKALGVSLNKVDDIAGSLLNFEESISSELEAELLTGKELNLETARQAALNGDLATVAEEVAKQVGSAADFTKMNRIQQEAMAKAVGMTREELAASLQEQEALKDMSAGSVEEAEKRYNELRKTMTAEEAMAEMGENALTRQFEQATNQEKTQAAQQKMADAMPQMVDGLMAINENFSSMFNKVKEIFDMFGGWKTVLTVIAGIMTAKMVTGVMGYAKQAKKAMDVMKAWRAVEKGNAIVSIIKGAWSSLGPIPFVGAALATTAIAGGMAYLASQMMSADDALLPAAGGSGYGKRTMFGPEGAIQFNNKDTIVAGTDLFANDAVSEPGKATQMMKEGEIKSTSGGADMSSVVNAINALGARVDALASRPINVGIDGNKVIEATTGANPKTDGDEMAKNSYQTQ